MKKSKILLLALMATLSINAVGASIDHIQNYSPEYSANPAQGGAVNSGASVYFNPAGLVRLENGTYVVVGAQHTFGNQEMKQDGHTYSANLESTIPNFAIYKKMDERAYYFTIGGIAGGAELKYKNSVPLPDYMPGLNFNDLLGKTVVTGSNSYTQATIGTSYSLTDKWSAAVAIRGIYGKRTFKADTSFMGNDVSIDAKRDAMGVGAQFGLNYARTERLNFGFRYDTKVKLNFKTHSDVEDNSPGKLVSNSLLGMYPVYIDGTKNRRDLPAIMSFGASYKVTDRWTTFIDGNYYFNKDATMDKVGDNADLKYHNGWEISLGSEYWLTNKFAWLAGANYAYTGAPKKSFSASEYALNSTMLGTGFKYKQNETTEWLASFTHYIYNSQTIDGVKYSKNISSLGLNFVKRF